MVLPQIATRNYKLPAAKVRRQASLGGHSWVKVLRACNDGAAHSGRQESGRALEKKRILTSDWLDTQVQAEKCRDIENRVTMFSQRFIILGG